MSETEKTDANAADEREGGQPRRYAIHTVTVRRSPPDALMRVIDFLEEAKRRPAVKPGKTQDPSATE